LPLEDGKGAFRESEEEIKIAESHRGSSTFAVQHGAVG
jgi:hypothetical protein